MIELTDEEKKMLTKYLGERWRDKTVEDVFEWQDNRTFTTRDDMMDLYRKLATDGKWEEFDEYMWFNKWPDSGNMKKGMSKYMTWLFCLASPDYEERCQMVADWLWKEASHES